MPRKTRLVISDKAPPYRSKYRQGDTVSCARYESEDDEGGTTSQTMHSKQSATVKETATFQLITEVVASKKSRKRSRRIHFGEDAGVVTPLLYADAGMQLDTLDGINVDANDSHTDYVYFSDDDGAARDGNVFTPIDLGTNGDDDDDEDNDNDENTLEPAIVSISTFIILSLTVSISDKWRAFVDTLSR